MFKAKNLTSNVEEFNCNGVNSELLKRETIRAYTWNHERNSNRPVKKIG